MFATVCIITYYCALIAINLWYMWASFSAELPWARCLESWGADCVDSLPAVEQENGAIVESMMSMSLNESRAGKAQSSSELYFLYDNQQRGSELRANIS